MPDPISIESECVKILCARGAYPLDSIYGAAYVFLDRCYLQLDAPDDDHVEVAMRGREKLDEAALRELAGEFGNELIVQVRRHRTISANRTMVQSVTSRALTGAIGPFGISGLGGELDGEDPFDDPLGIAVPWEEKYGKQSDQGSKAKQSDEGGEARQPDGGGEAAQSDEGDDASQLKDESSKGDS